MNREPVQSSNLASVGWDNGTLEVEFQGSGAVYRYSNVPETEYQALMGAPSVGNYFAAFVKGKYASERVS